VEQLGLVGAYEEGQPSRRLVRQLSDPQFQSSHSCWFPSQGYKTLSLLIMQSRRPNPIQYQERQNVTCVAIVKG